MFQTTKFSSSERVVYAFVWYLFSCIRIAGHIPYQMHPDIDQDRMDA